MRAGGCNFAMGESFRMIARREMQDSPCAGESAMASGHLTAACLAILLSLSGTLDAKSDFQLRASAFGSLALLPAEDLLRARLGAHYSDASLDVRSLFEASESGWEFALHHQLIFRRGDLWDAGNSPNDSLNSLPTGDQARAFEFSWDIDSGDSHALWHRLDRVSVGWSSSSWRVRLGRQALSWGNGLVFQPVDVLNPFSPVAVDTEYKPGDDMLLVERRFKSGQEVQAIIVARRGKDRDVSASSGSYGFRWHRPIGESDLEVFAMRHYDENMLGVGIAQPVAELLIRGDFVVTRTRAGAHRVSGVINSDATFSWGDTIVNLLVEYFHNGFGEDRPRLDNLRQALAERLARGELSTTGKHYLAVSAGFTPDLRWNYGGLLLANLADASMLAQIRLSFLPSDYSSVDMGLTYGFGNDLGDEYRGLRVTGDEGLAELTSGGGLRLYLRLARYF